MVLIEKVKSFESECQRGGPFQTAQKTNEMNAFEIVEGIVPI